MHVTSAESTELFTGPADEPLQLVRVSYRFCSRADAGARRGAGSADGRRRARARPRGRAVEVPVRVADPVVGERRRAQVVVGRSTTEFDFVVAEPGWTMHMVSHFHYDPVWWNTQAAYTSVWTEDPPGRCRQTNGFELVTAHLEMARREPEYKFVLAEVDYLKPYWDTHPEDRADLRRLIADGRVEIMGGTYNEPNTNLTSPETAIRNFVHGIGFQRDVMGADPATAWQLDVFGHDPQFPGMAADAGLTSSSWARGPYHQWGPMADDGDPERMQFASEFEWMAPSGRGLLTHYMPAHYAAGWWMDSSASLEDAEHATYELFSKMKKVALTRNVLLPGRHRLHPAQQVGHRDPPRLERALHLAAVRLRAAAASSSPPCGPNSTSAARAPSPQTRDMNPIYTGKDVSYIDTKQANRAAENAVLEAERFAVFAGLLAGATVPGGRAGEGVGAAGLRRAPRRHHRLGVRPGLPRPAHQLARRVGAGPDGARHARWPAVDRRRRVGGGVEPAGAQPDRRRHVHLDEPFAGASSTPTATRCRCSSSTAGTRSAGWPATCRRWAGGPTASSTATVAPGWEPLAGRRRSATSTTGCGSTRPAAAECRSLTVGGRELIADGRVGNELAVYDEYSAHPKAGEGPWHLLPKGPVTTSSSDRATSVQRYRSPLGERIVVTGRIRRLLRYTQTLTLWHGVDRVDCRTTIDEFTGEDRLLRLRWPCPVPGAMPVSEVGDAVIGRGFGLTHDRGSTKAVDTAKFPYTLDNPAYGWFGLSSMVRVRFRRRRGARAISVAEVVSPGRRRRPAGPRPDGGAGARGRHRHVHQRRRAPLRRSRRRLEPARRAHRRRRTRRQRLHRRGPRRARRRWR